MSDVVLEVRAYLAVAGREERLARRFAEGTFALLDAHGIEVVAFGRDEADPRRLTYVVRWPDAAAMERGWKAFAADEQWAALKAETEGDGPLIERIDRQILREIDHRGAPTLR